MSYLSDLLNRRITFSTFAAESSQWVSKAFGPGTEQQAGVVLSDIKQAASDAISLGDTVLGVVVGPAVAALEKAADAALLEATGGIAAPAIPLVNAGIDTMAATLKNAVDVWALKQKSLLVSPASPPPPS